MSSAVTVMVNGDPAVTVEGADTVKELAAAGPTETVVNPASELLTVSVAVMV